MTDDFVHLHVHSEYSLLDGLGRTGALAKRAAELGQPALALTDHGVMHGAIEFSRYARGAGIKPLIGVEAYLTTFGRPMEGRDPEQDRNRYHLLLLAENMAGYRNLLKICSTAQMDGYYYRPRIDADYLAANNDGLICTSGCLASELPTLLKNGDERQALERLKWYQDVFGKDRWYVEFQEHDIPELTQVNKRLFAWAKQYDLPMVVTNDVHYVKEEDANPHDVLLCVQTSSLVSQAERMRMSGATYFLKSAAQMRQTFLPLADLPDSAFTNTLKIAEMCDVSLEDGQYHLPDYPIPEGYDYQSYLRHLTMEGLKRRYNDRADDPEVVARTEHELRIIHEMGFDVYFLIVWDLCMYAKQRGIWWNVRGSGAGSIVAYATGITTLDPLRNKLIFERFLNPGRVTMPDFDLDFPDDQREELIRYTIEKYGQEQVAQVVTFGRMKARAAVRDIGRAMDIPLPDVDRLAKMIPAIPGKPVTIKDVLTDGHEFYSADLRQAYDDQDYVKELLDTAGHLEGVARHSSIHAAAVIVADKPLINYTPLMRPPKSAITDTVTQYEFPILESIGLLKIDFLGLATLTLMREATRLIRERHGIEYTLDNIPLDDPKTYELLTSGDVMGVFQVEGAGMRRVLMELRPSEFEHIGATIALYRPGPMEFIPEYISVLHGEKKAQYDHPLLEPILAETMGVCVYQEQVIQILTDIAGYTTGEADLVRRGISKKAKKVLDEHRTIFARGAKKKSNLSHAEADKIWDALMGFARYGFNRAHTADYAVIVAQTGYLKAHYPAEYMAALLTVERHDTEKVGLLIAECRRMGIEVLPPDVNVSANSFTIERLPAERRAPAQLTAFAFPIEEGAAIRMGLDAIKNVGEGPVETVLRGRGNRPFASLADFAERVDLRQVNRRGLECLIKVGALDTFGERSQLLAAIDRILGASVQVHEAEEVGQMGLFGDGGVDAGDLLAALPAGKEVNPKEILEWEKELVGVYVSSHPLQRMTADLVNVVTHGTINITEEITGAFVVLAGLVADVRVITTKKGDAMAFVRLEDLQGSVDVTVFPQLYRDQRDLWETDKIVIVRGKVDSRNGRVSIVAETVQNYVEGVVVLEDTSSVQYRYRNGGAPQGPNIASRKPTGASQLPAAAAPVYAAPPAMSDDDDGPYFDEANPFADDEPEWMMETGAPYEPAPPPPAQTEARKEVVPKPAAAESKPTAKTSVPTAQASKKAEPPMANLAPPPPAEPLEFRKRTARIVFKRSRSLDADRRRLYELVQTLSGFEGDDNFEIVVESNGSERYQLDFPNNRTKICRELTNLLDQRLGPGAWTIHPGSQESAA